MASASFSSDLLSEAIQRKKREKAAKKIRKRKDKGWDDIHEEIENLPYCEIQGQITKAFLCLKCSKCLITGKCVACYENEKKRHTLVDREEVWELEEKGFARIWGAPKRISESPQEIKQREEDQRILRLNRGIERLSNEYLEMKAEKRNLLLFGAENQRKNFSMELKRLISSEIVRKLKKRKRKEERWQKKHSRCSTDVHF